MSRKLTDICRITTGKLDSNASVENGKYPFFTCAPEPLSINEFDFDDNVILLTGNNAKGDFRVNRFNGKFNAYQRTYVITTDLEWNLDYIFYSLELSLAHFKEIAQGSQTKFLTMKILANFLIEDIPLVKQNKIAAILTAIDSKIALNSKINARFEQLAKLFYDYWFVQFDFPDEKDRPYKTSGGKMVFNTELKRNVPAGWDVKKLCDVLGTSLGGTPSTTDKAFWENGTINWLNSGEVANFPVVTSELKITEAGIRNSATELLPKGTVLLSITRHLRPTILAIDACANQSVVGIKEKGDILCSYIYPYLKNEIPRYLAVRTGAQQPHINKDTIDESWIIIPPKDILKKYNQITGPLYSLIINNAFQNQELSNLRDWLLPMLMNGQISISTNKDN